MATVGSMLRIPPGNNDMPFFVENLRQPAYDMPESCLACEVVGPHSPWYEPIFTYLKDSTFPPEISRSEKQSLIRQIARYTLLGGTVYHHGYDGNLLRCLDVSESIQAIKEVHEGVCGAHTNRMVLAKKLLRVGYYWPTMETDC
ncbi:hypothetical protein KI387_040866, partial [Taxus chinensis]